jgi:DNA replication and repair protein RecF
VLVQQFSASNFRCLGSIELLPDENYNLIYGDNASGKTSLLEALAYLGRGKSYRGAPTTSLIRHGEDEFILFGRLEQDGRTVAVGVRNGREGLEIRVDGETTGGAAALAAALPLQVIGPDIHDLVGGGPEHRRRYLDWIAFHVEHDYLELWRRFRRVLKQRNAALKAGEDMAGLSGWNAEFVELGVRVDDARRRTLETATQNLEKQARSLLGSAARFEYLSGWDRQRNLEAALDDSAARDRQQGSTQVGPQRADLRLIYDERQARRLVSRGQQKLLACAMILAAAETAQAELGQPLLLLLDDPAAELDGESLRRLMEQVIGLGCQIIATSLEPDALQFPSAPAVFHVEHGELERINQAGG